MLEVLLDDLRMAHVSSLAVTALDETAKAEILGFRGKPDQAQKRRQDPMLSHIKKQAIAVRPTISMGRLSTILGDDVCARLERGQRRRAE